MMTPPQGVTKRPNILLVIAEHQHAGVFSRESPCIAPNIRGLADSGASFSRYHTVNAICSPSRATIFSGVFPSRHGMVDCGHAVMPYRACFDQDLTLFPRVLADGGYHCGYFGKWHVERSEELGRFGFDRYVPRNAAEFGDLRRQFGLDPRQQQVRNTLTLQHEGYKDRVLCGILDEPFEASEEHFLFTEAAEFIRSTSKPWFAVVAPMAVHPPFLAVPETLSRYNSEPIVPPEHCWDNLNERPAVLRRIRNIWRDLDDKDYRYIRACYYAMSTRLDEQLGRLLTALDDIGERENTIVIYTADHGVLLGEHGLFTIGVPAFEESYRVPLFITGPGISAGTEVKELAGHADLCPTLLELAGLPPLSQIQGVSLASLLRGRQSPAADRCGYAEFFGQRFAYTQRIVWRDNYKYVFNGFDYDELYDLERDPGETTNLVGEPTYAPLYRRMVDTMWEQAKRLGDRDLVNSDWYTLRMLPVGPGSSI